MADAISQEKKNKIILYVEDEPSFLTIIPRLLKPYNLDVEAARDYNEGMIALEGKGNYSGMKNYDALLLDQNLPKGKFGLELAEYAKSKGYDKPIIIFSGMGLDEPERERLKKIGGIFIPKRIETLEKIVDAVERRLVSQEETDVIFT